MSKKGFGALWMLAAIVVLFVVGGGAWYAISQKTNQPAKGSIFDHKPGEKLGDWTLVSITGTSLKDIAITFSGSVTLKGSPNTRMEPRAEEFSIFPEEQSKLPRFPEDPRDYFPRGLTLDNGAVLLQKAQEEGIQIGVDPEGNDRTVTITATNFVTKADPYASGGLADHITFVDFAR